MSSTTENKKPIHTQGEWMVNSDDLGRLCSIKVGTSKLIAKTMYGDFNKEEAEANANRIVKCVNMHDELIEGIKKLVSWDGRYRDAEERMTIAKLLIEQAEQK